MPSNVSKGNHGTSDAGSRERGGQKATFGSGVSPEVSDDQAEVVVGEGEPSAEDLDSVRDAPAPDAEEG